MTSSGVGAVPELLPARMLNQFVYCPRLFYLEWVRKEWRDNAHTAEGDAVHHSIGKRGGRMPDPGEPEPPLTTCEVDISDDSLGLTAKIDRVDHADGSCSPVDYKRGKAPEGGGLWPGDEAQVGVQALLLESAGYDVSALVVSYRGAHRRVSVPWTDGLRQSTLATVRQAREVAAADDLPLPLVDSPKCVGCSLAPLCMPDEVNHELGRSGSAPRRIVPRDPDRRPLYVTEQGSYIGVDGRTLTVSVKGEKLPSVRILDVSHVCLVGNVQASTQAVTAVLRSGGSVLWLSYGGWLNGFAQPGLSKNVDLRRRQVLMSGDEALGVARCMVQGKILNQRTLLRRNHDGPCDGQLKFLKRCADDALLAENGESLMGIEGAAARTYFESFPRLLNEQDGFGSEFGECGRTRRPAKCPVNAVLNLTYSLLMKDVTVALTGVGFDPYSGFLHQPRFGRPALALDVMEEFRPIIADSVVIQLFNNGELSEGDFERSALGVQLTSGGRKAVIAAYERRVAHQITHPVYKYRISYRRVVEVQCRLLAAVVLGEIPAYTPMRTR